MEENQNIIEPGQTYICLNSEDGTKFEVDLITYREKGQQVKYLSVVLRMLIKMWHPSL